MRAVCWNGKKDIRVETVPDPRILNPRDAIIETELSAICGSDLHLYNGNIPTVKSGDILGHEFLGRVVEVGSEVDHLRPGDRVAVPFTIACGRCFYCSREDYSFCDNSNPNAWMAERLYGFSPAGLFGYSHMLGGYAGGQAQYVRVPFADIGPFKVPPQLTAEQLLFLTDIFPTGYQAAENCGIVRGDVVAVWGCGPVGQFAIQSAYLLGAERVIAIDRIPERLEMARTRSRAVVLNYEAVDVFEELRGMTGGRGPDACIDAVGMEAHGYGLAGWYDATKHKLWLETDRPTALRQAINACRKGGTVSIPGVYGGFIDKFPIGAAFAKGLTFKMGQTHVQRYLRTLLEKIEAGAIDPSFVITHRISLEEAPRAYEMFNNKEDGCIKVVLKL
ncbi:MAG: glutathione-dependent formaldehyde dehydrogenase [Deltaproteobacteria bacterium]|nr:glutathione-dependent formaldehyde dehydrogenase [Deltaproteobacteria bacterium]